MGYCYQEIKPRLFTPRLFTEEEQVKLLAVRDKAFELLDLAGAVSMSKLILHTGDVWDAMARVDRLVEIGDLREITGPDVSSQHRVFVKAKP